MLGVKPAFSSSMEDINVVENNDVRFECKLSGKPTPDVKWYVTTYHFCIIIDRVTILNFLKCFTYADFSLLDYSPCQHFVVFLYVK